MLWTNVLELFKNQEIKQQTEDNNGLAELLSSIKIGEVVILEDTVLCKVYVIRRIST